MARGLARQNRPPSALPAMPGPSSRVVQKPPFDLMGSATIVSPFSVRNSKINFQNKNSKHFWGCHNKQTASNNVRGDASQVSQTALADALQISSMASVIAFSST
jgi:hypothetical protein